MGGFFFRSASDIGFNRTVKHLFRHLHEPHALRRNRLVQHFFEATRGSGSKKTYERAALERIHELVRLGAAYCRDADLAAGKEEPGVDERSHPGRPVTSATRKRDRSSRGRAGQKVAKWLILPRFPSPPRRYWQRFAFQREFTACYDSH
jgi:hypothetical protein